MAGVVMSQYHKAIRSFKKVTAIQKMAETRATQGHIIPPGLAAPVSGPPQNYFPVFS
tara:strand:- start:465 stop:635 length:171 start_codon:yes stop_codon:yes gene_type:complete